MTRTRQLAACLDAIQPGPNTAWLAAQRPITPELKDQWARDDHCLAVQEQFWRDRCAALLGEEA